MAAKRVFIVDDDKEFLDELNEVLVLSGYEMTAVNDAVAAAETARKVRPDVILLDIKMPGKSGFQIAAEMRSFAELQNIPILAMSAFLKEEYAGCMGVCGIKTCLQKPFQPLRVIAAIEDALKQEA